METTIPAFSLVQEDDDNVDDDDDDDYDNDDDVKFILFIFLNFTTSATKMLFVIKTYCMYFHSAIHIIRLSIYN